MSRDNLFGASVIVTNPYDPTDRWDGVIISEPHYLRDGDIAYYNIQQTSGARIGYCGFFPTTHFVVK
ncbi:MAG TPA: hypothetical protein PKA58_24475 [Polyangium sp.]|nr:hypothetical protein [Polyangium sp.]